MHHKLWALALTLLVGLVMSGHGCVGQHQRHRTAMAPAIAAALALALPIPSVLAEGGKGGGDGKPKGGDISGGESGGDDSSDDDDDRKPAARPVPGPGPDPMATSIEERSLVVSGAAAAAQDHHHHQAYARAATPAARRHQPPAEAGDSPSTMTIEIDLANDTGFVPSNAHGPNHWDRFDTNTTSPSGRDRARARARDHDRVPPRDPFPTSPTVDMGRGFGEALGRNLGMAATAQKDALEKIGSIADNTHVQYTQTRESIDRFNDIAMRTL